MLLRCVSLSDSQDSGSLCFCFRWLLIWFKREFSFEDILSLWEVSEWILLNTQHSLETLACRLYTLYGNNTHCFTIYVSKHTVNALFCARFFGLVCPVKTSICWWPLPFWNHRGGSSSALTTTSTLFWRFVGNVFEVIFLNVVFFLFVCTVLRTVYVALCAAHQWTDHEAGSADSPTRSRI